MALGGFPAVAFGGASSSHWVVAVNGKSVSSRTVANHFCAIRDIPSNNVVVLDGIPDQDRISVEQFRELILKPILEQIQRRRITGLVQGIAYSTDFPTSIDIAEDLKDIPNRSEYLTPVASINGLTFFYRQVLSASPGYIGFEANGYASRPGESLLKPLIPSPEVMQTLIAKVQEEKFGEGAAIVDQELLKLPRELRPPMYVTAAQLWMKQGDSGQALDRLEQAALGGWEYRGKLEKDPLFVSLQEDTKMKRILRLCKDQPFDYLPFRGFDARQRYAPNYLPINDPRFGTNYFLSMVLGVARDFGITRFEVIDGLHRSAKADFESIEGTFLFSRTEDVRTTTRAPYFSLAIERLRMKGFEARVIESVFPAKHEKCAGLMIGTPNFDLARSTIEIMPGAISDNLTSLGGAMTDPGQTKLTEFIRNGAAVSSGAVYEPYSIINKFPNPLIQDAYTEGLTAAEAFYGNVLCPYQLLIVGDPLCQPFATPPRFEITGLPKVASNKESIKIQFQQPEGASPIDTLTFTLDGVFLQEVLYEEQIQIGLSTVPSGWHDFRVIAKSARPYQHCFERSCWFYVDDGEVATDTLPKLSWSCPATLPLGKGTSVSFEAHGFDPAQELELWNGNELYRAIPKGATAFEVDRTQLGNGPVRLQLRQRDSKGVLRGANMQILVIES